MHKHGEPLAPVLGNQAQCLVGNPCNAGRLNDPLQQLNQAVELPQAPPQAAGDVYELLLALARLP